MEIWNIAAAVFTSVLVVLNCFIAWRAFRVMKWLYKSRKMAQAIWSLYKTTEAWFVFAVCIIAVVILALIPLPEHVKTVAFYIMWTAITIFIAMSLHRVDKMLTDTRIDPGEPVEE